MEPRRRAPRTAPRARSRPPRPGPRATQGPPPWPARAGTEPDLDALRAEPLATVREHYPQADLSQVEGAFDLAVEAHAGQRRATGEPYVTHPIASAQITAELGI